MYPLGGIGRFFGTNLIKNKSFLSNYRLSPFNNSAGGRHSSNSSPKLNKQFPPTQNPTTQQQFNFQSKPKPKKGFYERHFKRPLTTQEKNDSIVLYVLSVAIASMGATYVSVPLYRLFCAQTGFGGTVKEGHDISKVKDMTPAKDRKIVVEFTADKHSKMKWNFEPQQREIILNPGETALAFYRAKNPTKKPIIGISTYNVIPFNAGAYFNKIQCFCFEEQILNPGEEVDMPVFFYIDPEFCEDPLLENCNNIKLSYTFFEATPGMTLPAPFTNVNVAQKIY